MNNKLKGVLLASILISACGGGSGDSAPVVTPEPEQEDTPNPFTPVENEPVQEPTETPEPVSEPEPTNDPVVEPEPEPTQEPVEGEDPVYSPDPIETVSTPVENPAEDAFDVVSSFAPNENTKGIIELNSVSTFNNKPSEMSITVTSLLDYTSIGLFCAAKAFDEWGNFVNTTSSRTSTDSWHALDVATGDVSEIRLQFSNVIQYGIDFHFVRVDCIAQENQSLTSLEDFGEMFLLGSAE